MVSATQRDSTCSHKPKTSYDVVLDSTFDTMGEVAHFNDLPVELLPLVVSHIVRPSSLATLCLVNKTFYTVAVPLLYERVFIYAWHKEGKAKACLCLQVQG